jgi:hypothetical protein
MILRLDVQVWFFFAKIRDGMYTCIAKKYDIHM